MPDTLARQRQIIGSSAEWSAQDLVLGDGELALERLSTGAVRARVGNGSAPFSAAPFLAGSTGPLVYRGGANPTLPPPGGAGPGDMYSASVGGVVNAAWGSPVAGMTVAAGDLLAKDSAGVWNIVPSSVDVTALVTRPELAASTGGALVGLPGRSVKDALTWSRTAPHANFAFALAIVPTLASNAPGRWLAGTSTRTAWDALYPLGTYSGGNVTRHISYFGNDADDGSNLAHAYKSLGKTRTVTGGTIVLHGDGVIAPADFRYGDTYPAGAGGLGPRRFIAPFGRAVVGFEGDNLATLTWTIGASATYSATLATTNVVHRLLRSDILDARGFPMPIPRAASSAAVTSSTYGWFFDPATKVLTVRVGGLNIETAFKTKLVPIYTCPDGALTSRIYIESTRVLYENIDFIGCYFHAISVAGQTQAKAWFRNCRFLYPVASNITSNGAEIVTQGCYVHRSAGDGVTYNDDVPGFTCRGLELDFRTFQAGDEDSYPGQATNPVAAATYNKQGSSVHGGNVVAIGGHHDQSAGPLIQDTGGYRWMEATEFGYPVDTAGTAAISLLLQGNNAWLSRLNVPTAKSGAMVATDGATVRLFECAGPTSASSGASFAPYIPAT